MEEKRLFLLDAYALIYRAYYALIRAPRVTSKGFNTSAIFGFVNTLNEILNKENPSHIAVCFDPSGPTFRHEEYPEYKAQRDKQPEDITDSIPHIKRILHAFRIPVIEKPGYEADDVIGTISRIAENEGFTVYMMTPDKDYGQLVTDNVLMYRPSLRGEGFELRGPQQVCDRYGIDSPSQVIDLLALEGDVSDNIPGCPGVGEKTAAKLIKEFGSVDNLLANTDKLKGALKKKIEDNTDKIRFSKRLVTICTDVPMSDFSIDELARRPENVDELLDVYRELEFRTFSKRLLDSHGRSAEAAPATAPPTQTTGSLFDFDETDNQPQAAAQIASIATSGASYRVAATGIEATETIERMMRAATVSIAVSVDGIDTPLSATMRGIALSDAQGTATYIALPADASEKQTMLATIAPLFAAKTPLIVSDDVKRLILMLRTEGIEIENEYFDVAVTHYLIEPEMKHIAPQLALRYLDYEMMPQPAAKGKQSAPAMSPEGTSELADILLQLRPKLAAEIEANRLSNLLDDIELPLVRVLAEMEWAGIRIDVAELNRLSVDYTRRLERMEAEAYAIAGTRFNIASPMQVGEVLFDRLKIDPKAKRTKSGAYSTTEEILEKHRHNHPIVDLILRIRALRKLLSTYINALPNLISKRDGKIHTSLNQTVTATGRISSTNPNIQNIPVRSDDGREIRRAFIPDPGCIMLSADYSQIELRLMAHMSGDKGMIEAFLSGADFHRTTAAKIYHEALDDVTDDQRRNAKTANFGIIYGISAFGLSERLGIPRTEARRLIDNYFSTYPGVKAYMESSIEKARNEGYVTTVMGRRRMLPDIHSRNAVVRSYAERNAINAPIQGSAADIIKLAMVRIYREMSRLGMRSQMILQVHDELIFNVLPEELPVLAVLVEKSMTEAFSGAVPLDVSAGTGHNWLEAH